MRDIAEIKADIERTKICDVPKCTLRKNLSIGCPSCGAVCKSDKEKLEIELLQAITANIPIARLEQLCNAERDGRCEVLPCKVGDTVYVETTCENVIMHHDNDYLTGTGAVECPFESTCDCEECDDLNRRIFETTVSSYLIEEGMPIRVFLENISSESYITEFGKTVFLTKEAAEQTLKGGAE